MYLREGVEIERTLPLPGSFFTWSQYLELILGTRKPTHVFPVDGRNPITCMSHHHCFPGSTLAESCKQDAVQELSPRTPMLSSDIVVCKLNAISLTTADFRMLAAQWAGQSEYEGLYVLEF